MTEKPDAPYRCGGNCRSRHEVTDWRGRGPAQSTKSVRGANRRGSMRANPRDDPPRLTGKNYHLSGYCIGS